MIRVTRMTPEGLEELLLVNGALVWPPEESASLEFATSTILKWAQAKVSPDRNLLDKVFSHTLQIVPADSVPAKEKA